jgi:hypothetical protein
VCPGGVFVVSGVVAEDADESVAPSAQGLVVGVAGGGVRSTRSALPMLPSVGF